MIMKLDYIFDALLLFFVLIKEVVKISFSIYFLRHTEYEQISSGKNFVSHKTEKFSDKS